MKKLLLCTLTLIQAVAIHAMDKGLSTIGKSAIPVGFITRHTQIAPHNDTSTAEHIPAALPTQQAIIAQSTVQPSTADHDQPAPTTAAALRQINPAAYDSQASRASRNSLVSDPYPTDDGNDEWNIITQQDARDAAVMDNAQNVLLQAQTLLPLDLKSCVKTNIHESSNPLANLETARQLIWACMTRTTPDFATSYIETLTKNFDPCKQYDPDFDASKVYAYFAYDNDVAMQEPNKTFAQLIKERLDKAVTEEDEKTQWFMRQFGFMFRDPATKQTYDAYLRGGIDALNALRIPAEQNDALQECFDGITEAKHALHELQKK